LRGEQRGTREKIRIDCVCDCRGDRMIEGGEDGAELIVEGNREAEKRCLQRVTGD
jgi:hypothetical protein